MKPDSTQILFMLALLDAFLYGYCLEMKHWKLGFLFSYYLKNYRPVYYIYRPLMFALDALGAYYIYNTRSIWHAGSLLLGYLLMSKDVIFYMTLGQVRQTAEYEKYKTGTPWLNWGIGYFLFDKGTDFKVNAFYLSGLIGLIINVFINLI